MPVDKMQASQQEVFQAYRPLLFSIAYRMLGSVMEAEDCVKEAFLQWHETLASRPAPAIENPRAYLCTLVTRRCIDRLRSARAQREAYVGLWLPEPLVTTDPAELSELSESLSMAFLLLLERLSPLERAVFVLRQVFDYDYADLPMPINGQPGLVGYLSTGEILHNLLASLEQQRREGAGKGGTRETTKQKLEFYRRSIETGEPLFALALTFGEKEIQEIDIIVNPDKLRHIPAQWPLFRRRE